MALFDEYQSKEKAKLKSNLLQTLTAGTGVRPATPGVRSSVLKWRSTQSRANPSPASFPCLTGKIQGISSILAPYIRPYGKITPNNQHLSAKFPTPDNREFELTKQGIN
jgi:hypothetical protein